MSLLPLPGAGITGLTEVMAQNILITAARRVAGVIVECHQARRRHVALLLAPDRQLEHPDRAPDSYAEFLFRTSAPLLHEPAARDRPTRRAA